MPRIQVISWSGYVPSKMKWVFLLSLSQERKLHSGIVEKFLSVTGDGISTMELLQQEKDIADYCIKKTYGDR
jgi:hypothetical protein